MSLSFGLSPWLLALCAVAAAALTYWVYRRTVPAITPARRAVLISLRFLALFIVLFLLFEPIWRLLQRDERAPLLAVLVDESQSLSLQGNAETGSVNLDEVTRQTLRDMGLADVPGAVRVYAFSNDTRHLPDNQAADSLRFDGSRTNIAQALDYVRDELKDDNLRGVLLLSDGQYNTGRNPLFQAERYPVPIHTVVVGDTTHRRDVQIRRVTTNEIAYVDVELPVQVGLRAEDFPDEQVVVSLFQNGELLNATTTQLPKGTAEVPVDLQFAPKVEGLQQLTVTVTQLAGEATYRNNTETFTVQVLRSKRKIVLLGAAPGPDLAAARQLLGQDANTEILSFVQKNPTSFYEGPFPATLEDIDLIVLVGYPGRVADQNVIRQVVAAAQQDTPLLFLLTQQTDLTTLSRYFEDVLPVLPSRRRTNYSEASLVVTPRGEQHPILDDPQLPASLRDLPPLLYNQSRWQVSPDARVLATIEMRGIPVNDPLLVIRERTGNRVASLLGGGTWRWRNLPDDLDEVTPFWPTLFSNLIQWLTTPEDDRRVRVQPVEDLFGGGETVQFSGQVYDESLNPLNDASVTVDVTTPDSTQFPYTMEPVGNGRYLLDIGTFPEGTYHYEAQADRNGVTLGADNGSFVVGGLTLEYKETRANAALMRQIAQRSEGTFFMPDAVGTLPAVLSASDDFSPVVFEEARETDLWRLPSFLVFVITLLTIEWFLRKRSGMV